MDGPEPRKAGIRWLDIVVSCSALFISAVSIFMTYQTSNSMERLVRASSWPFVQLGSGNTTDDGQPVLIFSVSNAGTGPARITSFDFLVDGRAVRQENLFMNIVRGCCAADLDAFAKDAPDNPWPLIGDVMTSPVAPGLIPPENDKIAMSWARTPRNETLWRAVDQARQAGRITMRACFCSAFDECWISETGKLPERIEGVCQAPPAADASRASP